MFDGIHKEDLQDLLGCINAEIVVFNKNAVVFEADESIEKMGVVLNGVIHVTQDDYWGSRTIVARIERGGMFGEAFSCVENQVLPVSVIAVENTEIMMLNFRKIVNICDSACHKHIALIKNMMKVLANKNILLTQKINILSQQTTRKKLLKYLSSQAKKARKNVFEIPFNRQELAEYLSVDRSALSSEISKLQNEGLLKYKLNKFEILES